MRFNKDRNKSPLLFHLLAIGLALWGTQAPAAVYQWQEDDGTRIYSQLPPDDDRPAREVRSPPPPATPPGQAQHQLQQLQQRAQDITEQRQRVRNKEIVERARQRIRAQNCKIARQNLRQAEQKKRLLMDDGQGGRRRMSPAEQAQRIGQYRKDVQKYCQ